jgi:hypothetical protein
VIALAKSYPQFSRKVLKFYSYVYDFIGLSNRETKIEKTPEKQEEINKFNRLSDASPSYDR